MSGKLEDDDPLVAERKIMQTFAEEEWARDGRVEAMAIVYMKRDPETGEPFKEGYGLAMVPGHFTGETEKDMFSFVVRALCKSGNASAVGMISETYQLKVEALDGETQEEATKRVQAMKAAQGGSLKGLPGVVETVMMLWEHHALEHCEIWMADIMRDIPGDESSPGTLGPWVKKEDYTDIKGRFTNFLSGAGKTDDN